MRHIGGRQLSGPWWDQNHQVYGPRKVWKQLARVDHDDPRGGFVFVAFGAVPRTCS